MTIVNAPVDEASSTGPPPPDQARQTSPATTPHMSMAASQRLEIIGRKAGDRRRLAELQDLDIGGDGPAVGRRHAVGVGIHDAIAVGDDLDHMIGGHGPQARAGETLRPGKTAGRHDAVAVAGRAVTLHAVDGVAGLAPGQKCSRHGRPRGLGGLPGGILLSHRPGRRGLIDLAIGEQLGAAEVVITVLLGHLVTARQKKRPKEDQSLHGAVSA